MDDFLSEIYYVGIYDGKKKSRETAATTSAKEAKKFKQHNIFTSQQMKLQSTSIKFSG